MTRDPPPDASTDARPAIVLTQGGEALGDAVIRLPTYRALRLAFPGHRIVSINELGTVLEGPFAPLRPFLVDRLFTGVRAKSHRQVSQLLRSLGNVDLVIDFCSNLRSLVSYLHSCIAARRFIGNVAGYGLRRGIPGFLETRPPSNARRYHRMVELAAGRPLPFEYRIATLPKAQAHAAQLLPLGPRYIGIVPGTPGSRKYWPQERHVALAAELRAMGLHPVYLLGPYTGEPQQRAWLERCTPEAVFLDPAAADGDLNYLPWLHHAAATRLVAGVAVDGGIGHLIASQDLALATLEGPTNIDRWRPVTPHAWVVRARDHGSRTMDAIPVSAVVNAVAEMVDWATRMQHQGIGRRDGP